MGLTIHYHYQYDGCRSDVRERLQAAKNVIEELPEDVTVPGMFHYEPGELKSGGGIGLGPDGDDRETVREYYRGSVTTSLSSVYGYKYRVPGGVWQDERPDTDGRVQMRAKPGEDAVIEDWEAFIIPVWVMEGCEPFQIVLGRPADGDTWHGRGFTKTQYAPDFVRAHLTVVAMLDIVDQLGVVDDVSDEGDYWGTRNLRKLTDSINEYRALVDGIGAVLEALADDTDLTVEGGQGDTNVVL